MQCCGSLPQKTPVSVKIRTYDARRVTRVAMENVHICMAKSNNSRGTLSAHSAVILTVSDIVFLLCLVPYDMTNKSLTKVFLRYSLASSVVAHPLKSQKINSPENACEHIERIPDILYACIYLDCIYIYIIYTSIYA